MASIRFNVHALLGRDEPFNGEAEGLREILLNAQKAGLEWVRCELVPEAAAASAPAPPQDEPAKADKPKRSRKS